MHGCAPHCFCSYCMRCTARPPTCIVLQQRLPLLPLPVQVGKDVQGGVVGGGMLRVGAVSQEVFELEAHGVAVIIAANLQAQHAYRAGWEQ